MQILTADIDQLSSATIDQAVAGPAGPFFRRTFSIRFQTGGSADDLAVDAGTATLQATFSSKLCNVLDAGSPVRAVTRQLDAHTVGVELDRPWSIKRITLKATYVQGLVEAYAMAIQNASSAWACAATADYLIQDHEVGMEASVSAQQYFQAHPLQIQVLRVDGAAVAPDPTVSIASGADLDVEFTAAVFAIRAVQDGTAPIALAVADVGSIFIETFPTGPRIGIATPAGPPDELKPEAAFWLLPGEIRDAAAYTRVNAQAGTTFADALQRHLKARLAQPAAVGLSYLDVALVVDSDAPCQAHIDLAIQYHLIRDGFVRMDDSPAPPEKHVLRFATPTAAVETLFLRLPSTAQVTQATLGMSPSFGSPPATPVGRGLDPIPADTTRGLHLTVDRWAAQPVEPGEALVLREIALGVMGLERGTELLVVLRADNNGMPGGAVMAQQALPISTTGRPQYVHLPLDPAIEWTAQRFWILAKAQSGAAVWLTREGAKGRMAVAQATTAGGIAATVTTIQGVHGYVALFSRHAQDDTAGGPLTLHAGGCPVALSMAANGRLQADPTQLAAALNTCLTTPSPDCPATDAGTRIPLTFSASAKGMLTVYPPELHYDIAE